MQPFAFSLSLVVSFSSMWFRKRAWWYREKQQGFPSVWHPRSTFGQPVGRSVPPSPSMLGSPSTACLVWFGCLARLWETRCGSPPPPPRNRVPGMIDAAGCCTAGPAEEPTASAAAASVGIPPSALLRSARSNTTHKHRASCHECRFGRRLSPESRTTNE